MKHLLYYLEKHPSKLFDRFVLQCLLLATASAFRRSGKCILFSKDPLQEYGEFSRECLNQKVDRKRLYRVMYRLGRGVRRVTGLTEPGDLKRLVFLLYRSISITMTGEIPGEIQVTKCYFSQIYSPLQCQVISAMDAGIVAGICGGKLRFCQRITEGCSCCKACVKERN